jgi:hypothetical protein
VPLFGWQRQTKVRHAIRREKEKERESGIKIREAFTCFSYENSPSQSQKKIPPKKTAAT